MSTSFTQKAITDKLAKHFVAIGFDLFGDREVTWFDGQVRREKDLAKFLKVQFTPTVLLLDEKGASIARINGFYPPHRFSAALDYSAQRLEKKLAFAEHMRTVPQTGASATLHEQPFFMKPPHDLRRKAGSKPLAVLFESKHCAPCDELHKEGFQREASRAALAKFDVARFGIAARDTLTTPQGSATTAEAWARELKIAYTPSVVFFDDRGKEVFRLEAYLRPFHFASSFEYVGSGAYRKEPEFQRFLQHKAEAIRERGGSWSSGSSVCWRSACRAGALAPHHFAADFDIVLAGFRLDGRARQSQWHYRVGHGFGLVANACNAIPFLQPRGATKALHVAFDHARLELFIRGQRQFARRLELEAERAEAGLAGLGDAYHVPVARDHLARRNVGNEARQAVEIGQNLPDFLGAGGDPGLGMDAHGVIFDLDPDHHIVTAFGAGARRGKRSQHQRGEQEGETGMENARHGKSFGGHQLAGA
jgi:thioredoxin-related protein